MTPSQLWTLLELRQRPATSTRLAVASGVERNTAYQRVAPLVRRGLARVVAMHHTGRAGRPSPVYAITPQGCEAVWRVARGES